MVVRHALNSSFTRRRIASQWICSSCSKSPRPFSVYSTSYTEGKQSEDENSPDGLRPEQAKALEHNDVQESSLDLKDSPSEKEEKGSRVIFSLIQPTGIPHIGNYLGALQRWKDLQDEDVLPRRYGQRNDRRYFGLADLHSLTMQQDPATRKRQIHETFASLLAVGLDPTRSTLFCQSHVAGHADLMWILSNVASIGRLLRMTQWKEKGGIEETEEDVTALKQQLESEEEVTKSRPKPKLGLLSYPVLQAADILLYQADMVPVGEDQLQHIEFTRTIARAFNAVFGKSDEASLLAIPQHSLSPAKRIMSLQDPTKKMSKSDPNPDSRILINDSEKAILHKLRRAKTDSVTGRITYHPEERPGVANLIDILRFFQRKGQSGEEVAQEFADGSMKELKDAVSHTVNHELSPIRKRYEELMRPDNPTIYQIMQEGGKQAGAQAGATLAKVKDAVGLLRTQELGSQLKAWSRTSMASTAETEIKNQPVGKTRTRPTTHVKPQLAAQIKTSDRPIVKTESKLPRVSQKTGEYKKPQIRKVRMGNGVLDKGDMRAELERAIIKAPRKAVEDVDGAQEIPLAEGAVDLEKQRKDGAESGSG